jgi:hypothetical protein
MATVLITGGTGLVGKALTKGLLQKGYSVIILSRNLHTALSTPGLSYALWNVNHQTMDKTSFSKADYIIHLAGAGVADKRWTKKRKQEIISSRVQSSGLLVKVLGEIPNNVKAVVSASAIGWYGKDPVIPNPSPFTEEAPAAPGFLGNTCQCWEESIGPVEALGKRLVRLRIGIVLSKDGGALKEFIKPMRWGGAAILGNGRQIISWIHIDDLVRLFITALENESMAGVYNAVAPYPVSNKQMVMELARARNKIFIPVKVPGFILKALLGEMSVEVLKSATVSSKKLIDSGFQFHYPEITSAISSLMHK